MQSRERILTTLEHREPDRIPLDIGGTHVTGIAIDPWKRWRKSLSLPEREPELCDLLQQICLPGDDLAEALGIDTGGLYPLCSNNLPLPVGSERWQNMQRHDDDGIRYRDEWQLEQFLPTDGLYYTTVGHPLGGEMVSDAEIAALELPAGNEPWRFEGLRDRAQKLRDQGKLVMMKSLCAGLFEMPQRIRGMENFLMDLLAEPAQACAMIDRFVEIKLAFWTAALEAVGDLVDVVVETDDYGTQESQLIPPPLFVEIFKPRWAQIIGHIKKKAPHVKFFLHSCGAVRPILGDFIEMGVDILNPVHVNAAGMDPVSLKKDFGDAITFWGGGVETQDILPTGTPEQVCDDVRRNIDALAPGGGWVFATVHNIQADVPTGKSLCHVANAARCVMKETYGIVEK